MAEATKSINLAIINYHKSTHTWSKNPENRKFTIATIQKGG
jgi:hypothetical protein